jgi:hypothetical protein
MLSRLLSFLLVRWKITIPFFSMCNESYHSENIPRWISEPQPSTFGNEWIIACQCWMGLLLYGVLVLISTVYYSKYIHIQYIVTYLLTAGKVDLGRTAIARQWPINMLSCHQIRHLLLASGAVSTCLWQQWCHTTIEELLLTVFSVKSVLRQYNDQLPLWEWVNQDSWIGS